jgi:hypothetical protein
LSPAGTTIDPLGATDGPLRYVAFPHTAVGLLGNAEAEPVLLEPELVLALEELVLALELALEELELDELELLVLEDLELDKLEPLDKLATGVPSALPPLPPPPQPTAASAKKTCRTTMRWHSTSLLSLDIRFSSAAIACAIPD